MADPGAESGPHGKSGAFPLNAGFRFTHLARPKRLPASEMEIKHAVIRTIAVNFSLPIPGFTCLPSGGGPLQQMGVVGTMKDVEQGMLFRSAFCRRCRVFNSMGHR